MNATEIRAAGRFAGRALGRGVTLVQETHGAVAGRTFGVLGPVGRPVRVLHDGISGAVYGAVRGLHRAMPSLAANAAALATPGDARELSSSTAGNVALGALNGVYGDRLARTRNELALSMSVRHEGADVAPTEVELASAYPAAAPALAVFVHGLCETDEAWFLSSRRHYGETGASYGSRLHAELGFTPIYLRYNTGLHVSDNGRRLAELLGQLVEAWPVGVREMVLVGHSMGGLVVRSACHMGQTAGNAWVDRVGDVFCLGTPHLGAPLERGANVLGWALSRVRETRPFANVVNARSVGIKDLRFGSCLEDDWRGHDPDEFLTDRCREVPFLPTASYYFIGATLTREPWHPLGAMVGDLLVQFPSASGRGRRRSVPFEVDSGRHLGGLHHFDLLNHPAVYEQLSRWLTAARPRTPAT